MHADVQYFYELYHMYSYSGASLSINTSPRHECFVRFVGAVAYPFVSSCCFHVQSPD
jgi:hypothetical protein